MALTIAFTSCMDADQRPQQRAWSLIAGQQPDMLLLLGDQIYMDWGLSLARVPKWKRAIEQGGAAALDEFTAEMHRRYKAQWEVDSFQALIRSLSSDPARRRVFVTWDEHDFAWNNAYGVGAPDLPGRHAVN